jgi:hypothetical protein
VSWHVSGRSLERLSSEMYRQGLTALVACRCVWDLCQTRIPTPVDEQPVVKVPASTETDEAPRWQGATTENIGPYSKKEQRSQRGCIVGRMPAGLSPRAARPQCSQ